MYAITRLVALAAVAVAACGAGDEAANGPTSIDANGKPCFSDESTPCTELAPGAPISDRLCGSPKSRMVAQTSVNFIATVRDAVDDVTQLCRSIAIGIDLGSTAADRQKADAIADATKRMEAWCAETAKATRALTARGGFTLSLGAGLSVLSVPEKGKCQARCVSSGKCDLKVDKPTCEDGSLQISCQGVCAARVGQPLECVGMCKGACIGACAAPDGVTCEGKCGGSCTDQSRPGVDATDRDGNCYFTCRGVCAVPRPPAYECPGECRAPCRGTCVGTSAAPVLCDGECSGDYELRTCTVGGAGDLKGGCIADRDCESLCRIEARATATFPPPAMFIKWNVPAADSERIVATFRAFVPQLYAIQQRIDGLYNTSADAPLNALTQGVGDIKRACIRPLRVQTNDAFEQIQATLAPVSKAIIPLEEYVQER